MGVRRGEGEREKRRGEERKRPRRNGGMMDKEWNIKRH